MKYTFKLLPLIVVANFILITTFTFSQTVTDVDGNIYNTVEIGTQTWLKEDLKVLHYPDSSEITEVWSYNDDDSLANIYGRLYTWDAAMNYSTQEGAQGICPNGWHIPTDEEWTVLGSYLGGDNVAGGKLKEEGTTHWHSPNTGATNESDFTALPAGEYDDTHYQLLHEYNVLWSSTEANSTFAIYRYISWEDAGLHTYTYYKDFRYSVRCLSNETVSINNKYETGLLIYPNPADMVLNFNQSANDNKTVTIYNQQGKAVKHFTVDEQEHSENINSLCPGLYMVKIENNDNIKYIKIIKK